jgi:citrate lyase subunit beta/citryl-CoA lyase
MTTRIERSMLYVPAAKWDMIKKASSSEADAVCIDLEDSVPVNEKAAARANVARAFNDLDFGRRTRVFRINGLDTPFAYRDIIEIVEAAGAKIDVVMVPKVHAPSDVAFVATLLTQIEKSKQFANRIGLEVQIETAAGFLYVREIAQASPRLEGLIFGSGDYSASMHMPLSGIGDVDAHDDAYPGHRWHAVMHAIVAAARANGLRAIEGPYAAFKDTAGFEKACRVARAMGFDGKQCIHPSQLRTCNTVFTPTDEEIAHAKRVFEAYNSAVSSGHGATTLDGKMIDEASIRMARVILGMAHGT